MNSRRHSNDLRWAEMLRRLVVAALAIAHVLGLGLRPAIAQGHSLAIVRDAEIEELVRDYAQPILRAAGLSKSGIDIILVNNPSFNAFVVGRRLFLNTGALMIAETPNEIIGVIAHEAGHIAGGHQERLRQQLARVQTMAIVSALLGAGVTVAGAATNNRGLAGVGSGIFAGGAEAARRSLLNYQRTEEATADNSAITYLNKTGNSARGMVVTFRRFESALSLSGTRVDPYLVSHPLPRDRIANIEELARKSRYWDKKDSPALQERHDLARAKIAAYTAGPGVVQRLFGARKASLASRYGTAISTFLYGNPRAALAQTDELLRERPGFAYYHELRGEILLKLNKPADAAAAYGKAAKLSKGSSTMLAIARGQALIASGDRKAIAVGVKTLAAGLAKDRENPVAYRFLSQGYGALGEIGEAELAAAEGNFYSGNFREAKIFALRAQTRMKKGSPGWLRAQDIINFKEVKDK